MHFFTSVNLRDQLGAIIYREVIIYSTNFTRSGPSLFFRESAWVGLRKHGPYYFERLCPRKHGQCILNVWEVDVFCFHRSALLIANPWSLGTVCGPGTNIYACMAAGPRRHPPRERSFRPWPRRRWLAQPMPGVALHTHRRRRTGSIESGLVWSPDATEPNGMWLQSIHGTNCTSMHAPPVFHHSELSLLGRNLTTVSRWPCMRAAPCPVVL